MFRSKIQMKKVFGFIAKEFWEILPAMIYFLIAFHIVALTHGLSLERYGIEPRLSVAATIMALIVAKAILVADALPIINRFPDRPLIWNVLWKTLIYGLVAFVFRYLEEWIPRISDAGGMAAANHALLAEIVWPHFWAVQILLVVTIVGYTCMAELSRVLGPGTLGRYFFGTQQGTGS